MAKQVKQVRYYGESTGDKSKNWPTNLALRNLVSGSAFANWMPVIQLGIQSLPGTKFYLNGSPNPIIIGNTGIYELELEGMTEIVSLTFDQASVQAVSKNQNAYIIVDMIYEDGQGG